MYLEPAHAQLALRCGGMPWEGVAIGRRRGCPEAITLRHILEIVAQSQDLEYRQEGRLYRKAGSSSESVGAGAWHSGKGTGRGDRPWSSPYTNP